MFIPDPDFYPSRIPDLGSKNSNKREDEKKFVVITFLIATSFELLMKKIWANFQRIIEFLPKNCR
jgi:hypothetical protein